MDRRSSRDLQPALLDNIWTKLCDLPCAVGALKFQNIYDFYRPSCAWHWLYSIWSVSYLSISHTFDPPIRVNPGVAIDYLRPKWLSTLFL